MLKDKSVLSEHELKLFKTMVARRHFTFKVNNLLLFR